MSCSPGRLTRIGLASLLLTTGVALWSVPAANAAPTTVTANPDADTVSAGSSVNTDVRFNDTSTGTPLALPSVLTQPAHGTAAAIPTGLITYTPAAHFSGIDTYTYRVCDTSAPTPACATATVTITVDNVFVDAGGNVPVRHDRPTILNLADLVTTKGAPIDPTSVTAVAPPTHGSISISRVTGDVTYTPVARSTGVDSFGLLVSDTSGPSAQTHQLTVALTVQPNTVVAQNLTITTGLDLPTPPINILALTTTGSALTPLDPASVAVPARGVTGGPQHGTVTINATTGRIVYTPDASFLGVDPFQYTVCDTSTPVPVCDTKTITIRVRPIADLSTAVTLDQPTLLAGAPFSYTVTVANLGPADATNVHSIDVIDGALLHPRGTPDASVPGATCTTRALTPADLAQLSPIAGAPSRRTGAFVAECVYPTLAAGTRVRSGISGTVDPALPPGEKIFNQTLALSDNFDPNPANNLASTTNVTTASADLQLTKTASAISVRTGDTVVFTVSVVNLGPSDASGVDVSDIWTGLSFVSAKASAGGFVAPTRVWTIGRLNAGQTVTLRIVEKVDALGAQNVAVITRHVTVDPNPANNGGSACTPGRIGCGLVKLQVAALSFTGAPIGPLLWVATLLLITGGAAMRMGRRRPVGYSDGLSMPLI